MVERGRGNGFEPPRGDPHTSAVADVCSSPISG